MTFNVFASAVLFEDTIDMEKYHKSTELREKSQTVGDRPVGYLQSVENLNLRPPILSTN